MLEMARCPLEAPNNSPAFFSNHFFLSFFLSLSRLRHNPPSTPAVVSWCSWPLTWIRCDLLFPYEHGAEHVEKLSSKRFGEDICTHPKGGDMVEHNLLRLNLLTKESNTRCDVFHPF